MYRKIILCMIFILFVIIFTACKNKNISSDVYNECKHVVSVTEDYLDFKISVDEAKSRFNRIKCDSNGGKADDAVVCSKIGLLSVQITGAYYSNNDSEIKETLIELKNSCGL